MLNRPMNKTTSDDKQVLSKKIDPVILSIKHIRNNDLIYGQYEIREMALKSLKIKLRDGMYAYYPHSNSYLLIDHYNEITRAKALSGYSYFQEFNILLRDKFKKEETRSAYDFHLFAKQFEAKFADDDNYYISRDPGRDVLRPFFKKRCKYGILWTINRGNTIHFVFDDKFNFSDCFNKTQVTYTNSELRFIYRHWNELAPLKQIRFWKQNKNNMFEEISAPWENDPSMVKSYKPKNSRNDLYIRFFQDLAKQRKEEEINKKECGCTLM